MCGRFTIVPTIDFHERFGLPPSPAVTPRYNVAPGQEVPIIVCEDRNCAVPMVWGFIPSLCRNPVAGRPMINARAETLVDRPPSGVPSREPVPGPRERILRIEEGGCRKIPFYIRLKSAPLFSFAGLFGIQKSPGARVWDLYSYHHGTERSRRRAPRPDAGHPRPRIRKRAGSGQAE